MSDLKRMLITQHQMQRDSFGADPTLMSTDEAIEFIHWNVTALTDELHEMLGEIGWKPWASSRHIHGPQAAKEMIDAWHFFMNIMLALGPFISQDMMPGQKFPANVAELAEWWEMAYNAKKRVNEERQAQGYDGVSTKCSTCKREISEIDMNNLTCSFGPEDCPYKKETPNG